MDMPIEASEMAQDVFAVLGYVGGGRIAEG
jgi:hypothetical protein